MKKLFIAAIASMVLAGCTKDIKNDVKELQKKFSALESVVNALQQQLDACALISSITPLANNAGWKIEFTGGTTPFIEIKNGANGITPLIEVRVNPNGTTSIWYNATGGYPELGWVNTGVDIKGPAGSSGSQSAVGATGQQGPAGITPAIRVTDNADNTFTIEYNITDGYPSAGWVSAGASIPASPTIIHSIVDNDAGGTITFTVDDGTGGTLEYEFEKASTAVRFEIISYGNINVLAGDTAQVVFRVNPSTAWVPTGVISGAPASVDNWALDLTATRVSYINTTTEFSIVSILKDGAKEGQYIAKIKNNSAIPAIEYIMALVLNVNSDTKPVLISSSPFIITTNPVVTAVAAGGSHSLALKSDGKVWAWGGNGFGQLGDGTNTAHTTPAHVSDLTEVTAIAAGNTHSLALKSDGTVWAWGYNGDGRLGDGTNTNRYSPVQVQNLTGVTAIAVGEYHSLALKSDGTIWAWGNNDYGQLGDGTYASKNTPVQVFDLTGAKAISAGVYYSLALKSNNTVWAWGRNGNGQLGDGTTIDRLTPVQVSDLTGAKAIAASYYHTLALKSDGTVWAWGNNDYGQLGDGTYASKNTPVQVFDLTGAKAIAAGVYYSLALNGDGTVWAWGLNNHGQLGDGTNANSAIPVQTLGAGGIGNISGVTAIAASYYHTLALKSDNTVWAWGRNNSGQLGDKTTINRTTPVLVDFP